MTKDKKTPDNIDSLIVQALLSNNSESIYFKDLDSKFIAVSDFHARYFGVESSKDLIGKSDFDFFTKQHAMAAYNDEQEIINTGKPIVGKIEQESWQGQGCSRQFRLSSVGLMSMAAFDPAHEVESVGDS